MEKYQKFFSILWKVPNIIRETKNVHLLKPLSRNNILVSKTWTSLFCQHRFASVLVLQTMYDNWSRPVTFDLYISHSFAWSTFKCYQSLHKPSSWLRDSSSNFLRETLTPMQLNVHWSRGTAALRYFAPTSAKNVDLTWRVAKKLLGEMLYMV